jgi:two-component system, cell cycle sensor histidine kinase and response regulator CckA
LTNSGCNSKVPIDVESALIEALTVGALPLVVANPSGLVWMNQAACRLIDADAPPVPGEAAATGGFEAGLSRAILEAAALDGTEQGSGASGLETSVCRRDGRVLPLSIAATPIEGSEDSVLGMLSDLRASRSVEDAVRRAEERFESLVECMLASVWILRRRRVIYANRAAADLFGVDRSLLIGVDVAELFHPEDVPALAEHLERVERGEVVLPHEYRAMARDRSILVLELSSVTLIYDNEPTVLSFGRDVTERKREEQRLLQADRLSALGMLASGMAHAINDPLTYVLLNLDHLSRCLPGLAGNLDSLPDTMARLAEAREGADRMATIVKRMRSFARTDESSNRVLDLRAVLESVVDLVGHEVHHRGKLTTRFENVPPVLANESKVEQICLGLLLFAAQMLPDDAAQQREVRLSLEADERQFAVLEIVCEGCNVTESDVQNLFDPFSASDDGKVLGFGLNVCSGLVEQLGGQIEAELLPGTGLLLRTAIPCVSLQRLTETKLPSSPPSSMPPLPGGKARVLVVDDDPGVGRALRLMLEQEHDVKSLVKPREALQELLSDSGYDLVFCDLMMPDLSGMDIYQVLRFNRPGYEAKIVFMTGGAFTPSARRFLAQIPNQRIEKPFNLHSLQRLVQKSVRRHG